MSNLLAFFLDMLREHDPIFVNAVNEEGCSEVFAALLFNSHAPQG